MQAGDSIEFMKPPELLSVKEQHSEDEQSVVVYSFYNVLKKMLSGHNGEVRYLERPEQFGIVTAKETAVKVPFNDGSYLYIVAYGHEFEDDYMDLGLSVVEHDGEGTPLVGYVFELTGADLAYTVDTSLSELQDEHDASVAKHHFSLINQYRAQDELELMAITADDGARRLAQQALEAWNEAVSLALTDRDVGLSWFSVSPEQMRLVFELVQSGVPVNVTH